MSEMSKIGVLPNELHFEIEPPPHRALGHIQGQQSETIISKLRNIDHLNHPAVYSLNTWYLVNMVIRRPWDDMGHIRCDTADMAFPLGSDNGCWLFLN